MNKKIIVAIALFALVFMGTMIVAMPKAQAATISENVYNIDNPYQTDTVGCTRYCPSCVKYGHNGACTMSGSCC